MKHQFGKDWRGWNRSVGHRNSRLGETRFLRGDSLKDGICDLPSEIRYVLFDWGDTLMRDFPGVPGKMCEWSRVEAIPKAKEVLSVLRKTWRLALATSAESSEDDIRKALDREDLGQFIDRIFCFRSVGHKKSSPEFYRHILGDLGLAPNQVVMVGDNFEADILGANRCGIRAVWFREGVQDKGSGEMWRMIGSLEALPAELGIAEGNALTDGITGKRD